MGLSTIRVRSGSSPRGRGKLHGIGPKMGEARLIPARAGKTQGHR